MGGEGKGKGGGGNCSPPLITFPPLRKKKERRGGMLRFPVLGGGSCLWGGRNLDRSPFFEGSGRPAALGNRHRRGDQGWKDRPVACLFTHLLRKKGKRRKKKSIGLTRWNATLPSSQATLDRGGSSQGHGFVSPVLHGVRGEEESSTLGNAW